MALFTTSGIGEGGAGVQDRLPKILTELQNLTISGPLTGAGVSTAIEVTGIGSEDTIIKAVNLTDITEIALNTITITDRRATGTITLSSIAAGDVVGVNGKNYTAVAVPGALGALAPYTFSVGTSNATAAASLAAAIMSADTLLVASSNGAVVTIFYRDKGTAGNSIALAVTGSNGHATRSAATLAGGTATSSIKTTVDTTSKKVMLYWYNKQ